MKLFNHRISPKISFRKGVRKIRLTENAESVPLGVFFFGCQFFVVFWPDPQTPPMSLVLCSIPGCGRNCPSCNRVLEIWPRTLYGSG